MNRMELVFRRIKRALQLNYFQFIKYNFFSKNVHRAKGAYIIPFRPGKITLDKDAEIYLNGTMRLNQPQHANVLYVGKLDMHGKSKLIVNGLVVCLAGYNVVIDNGVLQLDGDNTFTDGSHIVCENNIIFGEGSGVSYYAVVRDYTGHPSGTNPDNLTTSSAPVVIGKHVWIGERAFICRGSVIGDGAVIGGNATVSGTIPPRAMVAPAIDKVVLSDIYWYICEETKDEEFRRYYSDQKPISDQKKVSAPKEAVEKVRAVFTALGYDENISEQQDLMGCNIIDSLAILSLSAELEERFSVKIPIREVNGQNFYSVETIAALMDQLAKDSRPANAVQTAQKHAGSSHQERKPLELRVEDTEKTVVQRIFENSVKTPDKTAVIAKNTQTTYHELCKLIYSYSETFRRLGVKAGDNVVLQAIRDVRYIAACYACHLLSAVSVPIEDEIGKERAVEIADVTNAQLVICSGIACGEKWIGYEQLDAQTNVVSDIPIHFLKFPDLNGPAQILFTTGTTGKSKGVIQSQKCISLYAYLQAKQSSVRDHEVQLSLFPLNHCVGIDNLHTVLVYGQTLVLVDKANDISLVFDTIKKNSVTAICCPPVLLRLLMLRNDETDMVPIDYVIIAGAPIFENEAERFYSVYKNTKLINNYGASESPWLCSTVISDEHEITLGYPNQFSDVRLKVSNTEYTNAVGTVGQICVKSPLNMLSYYNEPELTRGSFDGEYLLLSDLAFFDEKGRLHFAGRADDVINIGGYKTSPIEIEAVADESGLVQESILIKSFDKHGNEYLELLAVPKEPEFSSEALMRFIKDKVEAYRVPKKITVVDELKKTYNGKLDRKAYRS